MTIIDTHLHIIDRRRLSYPWIGLYPQLQGSYLYEAYRADALGLGIDAALLMEVDVPEAEIEDEADMAAELRGSIGGPLRGAISSCRPESADFPAFLERQKTLRPFVRGFRRVLHVVPDGLSEDPRFRSGIAALGDAGYPFDLCVLPRQLSLAAGLADACPEVQFVLDHCGQPDIAAGEWSPWAEDIDEISRRPNVAVKISGIVAYAGPGWTVATLRPYVEHCIRAFGWERVVWGSDWPICLANATLRAWVEATHALLVGCSLSERRSLMELNARAIWRI